MEAEREEERKKERAKKSKDSLARANYKKDVFKGYLSNPKEARLSKALFRYFYE